MTYKITIKKIASKELERIPLKVNRLIVKDIWALADNPRPTGCKKLKGKNNHLWRIRIGDYRVLYSIDDSIQIIDIQLVGHRKDIYT